MPARAWPPSSAVCANARSSTRSSRCSRTISCVEPPAALFSTRSCSPRAVFSNTAPRRANLKSRNASRVEPWLLNHGYAADDLLSDYLNLGGFCSSVLRGQRRHSLCPALEPIGASEGNNDRENFCGLCRHHGALRVARWAAVRTNRIAKYRQAFQVQIVFRNPFVRFPRPAPAEHNFTLHVRQIVQPNGQAAFHGHEIDHVHDGVDLRHAPSGNNSPQQTFHP